MVEVEKRDYGFNQEKFKRFCEKYGFVFPQEYVDYLKEYNDGELEDNILDFVENACSVRYFYGTSDEGCLDICYNYEEIFKDRMPKNCVPIADEPCGNQICMSLSEDTYGKIYFWDHETMDTDDDEICTLGFEDMYFLADSFGELLDKIEKSTFEIEFEEETNFFKRIMRKIFG